MSELEPLSVPRGPITTLADAGQALKVIAVAEAAETLWARAKDSKKMFEAVVAKLTNQAAYAVWRQNEIVPSQITGGPGRGKRFVEQRSVLPAGDPGKDVVARWRQRLCKRISANAWCMDQGKFDAAFEDAFRRCVRICEQENLGTIRGTEGTGEFERYTPSFYIEKAREVLGAIDLDPASSEYAQQTVRAGNYFTVADDGLSREWFGRVWLNPPYHRELAPLFIDKLIEERINRHVSAAVVLTNNSTDTVWFEKAVRYCSAICFTRGRIRFEVPNAEPVLPTQGQAFLYFGNDRTIFTDVFDAVGFCVEPL